MNTLKASDLISPHFLGESILVIPDNIDVNQLKSIIQAVTGIRRSNQLQAALDIIRFFAPIGSFGTYELLSNRTEFKGAYTRLTLNRAVNLLKKANIIKPVGIRQRQRGGQIYSTMPFNQWGYCPIP